MKEKGALGRMAREAVEAGLLPNRRPDRAYGGPGLGSQCVICHEPVTPAEMELELEFARADGHPELDRYHLHSTCFAAWDFERHDAQCG